jgi:large subunit ribosomal protein L6
MASRVGRKPIEIPAGVDVKINGQEVTVKGKLGELKQVLPSVVSIVQQEDKTLQISLNDSSIEANAISGTMRALLNNMTIGVSQGFERKLLLVGVGFRAKAAGSKLNLSIGFSHPVDFDMPNGVTVDTPTQTEIILKGADKHQVNQMAANIRAVRPPEPYKGKGIRYSDEQIILKEGKKK